MNNMARELTPIDISHVPDLLRLAEEVAISGKPRVLRRDSEDVAILMPLRPTIRRRSPRKKTAADHEAFLASAGSWADVDTDKLLENIYESRRTPDRPPVDL
jgi:hypothetical protein